MSRVEVVQPPPDMCRFAEGAFIRMLGQRVPISVDGHPAGLCTVVDAEIIEGGYAVRLVLDIPDDVVSSFTALLPGSVVEQNKGS